NLIGMGVLPLQFRGGEDRKTLGLKGDEIIDIALPKGVRTVTPRQDMVLRIRRADGSTAETTVMSRLDTENEIAYFKSGGILQYVLNNLVAAASK
ncbi:MAG: hypothetical protein KDI31_04965, partial [Pseudomonadales bacterium]|nr:hypothetical protein [Pseudomonadales bacterium]